MKVNLINVILMANYYIDITEDLEHLTVDS